MERLKTSDESVAEEDDILDQVRTVRMTSWTRSAGQGWIYFLLGLTDTANVLLSLFHVLHANTPIGDHGLNNRLLLFPFAYLTIAG